MRKQLSAVACFGIIIIFIAFRFLPENYKKDTPFSVTTWDAFGYYMYLPAIVIHQDFKELAWLPAIDKKYSVSGGSLYQANKCKNGNYAFKYLGGVSILETPFFLIAHFIAPKLGYEADGFSAPYQHATAFGAMIYCFLSLLLLRKILLRYYNDAVTALTLLMLMLASNLIQYIAVDGAMSHAYIFPLYVLVLFFTIKWHEKPSFLYAFLIGTTIGLATICRPTELIMLFIPLLWGTQNKEVSSEKWQLVKQYQIHLLATVFGGFLGILPQLIYWKIATGSFVYDVGSKWYFLNPYFRVLFGWEVGWFIYTPITIFFMAGMFFIKEFPFKKSVITFCLLNIYIIIAWSDWRYGATYSCRALVQSYPIFALPLAAFINTIYSNPYKYLYSILGLYLIIVNLFQVYQYDKTILHYRDMNRAYYASIYLNPNPSPLDMSLLDNNDRLYNEEVFSKQDLCKIDTIQNIDISASSNQVLFETQLNDNSIQNDTWIKIEATMSFDMKGISGCYLNAEIKAENNSKVNKIRLTNALTKKIGTNDFAFFVKIPASYQKSRLKLFLSSDSPFNAKMNHLSIKYFYK